MLGTAMALQRHGKEEGLPNKKDFCLAQSPVQPHTLTPSLL